MQGEHTAEARFEGGITSETSRSEDEAGGRGVFSCRRESEDVEDGYLFWGVWERGSWPRRLTSGCGRCPSYRMRHGGSAVAGACNFVSVLLEGRARPVTREGCVPSAEVTRRASPIASRAPEVGAVCHSSAIVVESYQIALRIQRLAAGFMHFAAATRAPNGPGTGRRAVWVREVQMSSG